MSGALIADGIHSFSDLVTDFVAIIGDKLSNKTPDAKHPYGHGNFEYITSSIIGIVIVIVGSLLIYKSFTSKSDSLALIVIIVSIFTIIAKYVLAKYIINQGKKYRNNILISSGRESFTDVISSIVVLLSAFLTMLEKYNNIFSYADNFASIIVGMLIIKTGIITVKENLSILLGEQETDIEYINNLKKIILKNKEVKNIDSLILLKFGAVYKLSCEVSMDYTLTLLQAHNEVEKLEKDISKYDQKIKFQTIHVNPFKGGTNEFKNTKHNQK